MKILLADDHQIFLDGLSSLLKTLVYVTEVICVNSAVNIKASLDSSVDIAIIDIRMPGMAGVEFVSALIKSHPTTPFIVMSATENQSDINHVMRAGAATFIPKAAKTETILKIIEQVIEGDSVAHVFSQLSEINISDTAKNLPRLINISERQIEVLRALAAGMSNQNIATTLNISEHTVKSHLSKLFKEFDVNSRLACVHKARDLGFI